MQKNLFLIKSNQLFEDIPFKDIPKDTIFLWIESHHISKKYNYIKQKLVFLFSTMREHRNYIESKGYKTIYYSLEDNDKLKSDNDFRARLEQNLIKCEIKTVNIFADYDLKYEEWLYKLLSKKEIKLNIHQNPMFLGTRAEYLSNKIHLSNKISFSPFYIQQRKKFKALIDEDNKPIGGQWNFDKQNRKPIKNNLQFTREEILNSRKISPEEQKVINEVEKYFGSNPGVSERIWLPVTFKETKDWFEDFLEKSFYNFGDYEDSVSKDHHILYHSVMTPMLNAGLITPKYILNRSLKYGHRNKIPINDFEGYIRQIIGWREYMFMTYLNKNDELMESNYFGFDRSLPDSFYKGETSIDPIDHIIKKVLDNGYLHHIERLMFMGNFMLLCRIKPKDVYKWFLEMFTDAYSWVMVSNVMGMSQYSAGAMMITKPYISSSSYILRMSNYKKGEWTQIWDALYWSFLLDYREKLQNNPRIFLAYKALDKKTDEEINNYKKIADEYLKNLK